MVVGAGGGGRGRRGQAVLARSKFSLFPTDRAIHMLINHAPIGHLGGLSGILTGHNCSVNKSTNKDPEVWGDRGQIESHPECRGLRKGRL